MNKTSQTLAAIPGLLTNFSFDLTSLTDTRLKILGLLTEPGDTEQISAQRCFGWAVRGDLRALFAPVQEQDPDLTQNGALEKFRAIENKLSPVGVVLRLMSYAGVSQDMRPLLEEALRSDLPQRRLEGWCALLCLCALNRTDL